MGKNTDKLFITHSEWSGKDLHAATGGKLSGPNRQLSAQASAMPFWTCSISQQPIDKGCGVCDGQGHVFDIKNILPYIARQGINPVTGEQLKREDLIRLEITEEPGNEDSYIDPVTYKHFQRLTDAVVIKTSGQVYFAKTIKDMCLKTGNLEDLVTGKGFGKNDIIHLKGGVGVLKKSEGMLKREMEEQEAQVAKRTKIKEDEKLEDLESANQTVSSSLTTHHMAASATSTAVSVATTSKFQTIPLEQLLVPKRFEGPGYAVIETNVGSLNVELWSKYSPKAVYNFVYLAKQGYFNGISFHRNIKHFMIQGGDPSGTGRGGPQTRTAFPNNAPFKDETNSPYKFDSRGLLAMANKGKNTNTSQFFITYGSKLPHLDGKHTIFGKVVGGVAYLDDMERAPVDSSDRPKKGITIQEVRILLDPFEEDTKKSNVEKSVPSEEDNTPWLKKSILSESTVVGKYLKTPKSATSLISPSAQDDESRWKQRQKNKTSISKSSFSGW